MGWINIGTLASGNSTGTGDIVRIYSIADEVGLIHDRLIDFIKAINPGVLGLLLVTIIGVIIIALFMSVWSAINRMTENQSPY